MWWGHFTFKIFINYIDKSTSNPNPQTSAKRCFVSLLSPSSSLGHSSQGSPQPSPGILLQQHFAFVVLKALGTEHFPFSKFVKQKLWRVSVQESRSTVPLTGHFERWNNLHRTLFLTEHCTWGEHMQIRLAVKRSGNPQLLILFASFSWLAYKILFNYLKRLKYFYNVLGKFEKLCSIL